MGHLNCTLNETIQALRFRLQQMKASLNLGFAAFRVALSISTGTKRGSLQNSSFSIRETKTTWYSLIQTIDSHTRQKVKIPDSISFILLSINSDSHKRRCRCSIRSSDTMLQKRRMKSFLLRLVSLHSILSIQPIVFHTSLRQNS